MMLLCFCSAADWQVHTAPQLLPLALGARPDVLGPFGGVKRTLQTTPTICPQHHQEHVPLSLLILDRKWDMLRGQDTWCYIVAATSITVWSTVTQDEKSMWKCVKSQLLNREEVNLAPVGLGFALNWNKKIYHVQVLRAVWVYRG